MIISQFPSGGGGITPREAYAYTGEYEEVTDDGGVKIRLLSSGIFVVKRQMIVDIFAVGGGSGGFTGFEGTERFLNTKTGWSQVVNYYESGGGGSGGNAATVMGVTLIPGTQYEVVIGQGGAHNAPGEETRISGIISASGGSVTHYNDSKNRTVEGGRSFTGAWGGTGGGGGTYEGWEKVPGEDRLSRLFRSGGNGGSDGGNGSGWGFGVGQGETTREFGEVGGALYAAGGAGGSLSSTVHQGGNGGGGNGASTSQAATSGAPNTGSGGGGGCYLVNNGAAGSGGSGIIIIRNARNE